MKLKFKVQQYQTDAVENTVRVFNGQPNDGLTEYLTEAGKTYGILNGMNTEADMPDSDDVAGYRNSDIRLSEEQLLENINQVQSESHIRLSGEVVAGLGRCQLDIEMETGTGKTYVYTRTIFELNKRYGWSKFIIVVPSIAIREGVSQSLDFTESHFMELYHKKIRHFIYNSSHLNVIDTGFSRSSDICVMIINTQAFNTIREGANNVAARIINSCREEFGYRRPIDVIAANRPIIILDEPQKMGGAATKASLARFNPLFTLNYSATHKEAHNLIYVLDALDAYNKKLVKRIEVVGIELKKLQGTDGWVYLEDIVLSSNAAPKARLGFDCRKDSGEIGRKSQYLSVGDSLYVSSNGLEQYRDFTVSDIYVDTTDSARSFVGFSNGRKLYVKDLMGDVSAEYKARIQIRETIKAHLRKESVLFQKGIKTLSLFFLDEVSNYRRYDADGEAVLGPYAEIFEEEYRMAYQESSQMFSPGYRAYLDGIDVHETHTGYFSIDKKGRPVNSETRRGSDTSDDISAYDLILRNKEQLLSLDRPERFIFSHSALREGWDNPNVFQICALRQSDSISQKRQEVGRGLRLCVNRRGERMDAEMLGDDVHKINKLTVIASEGYASFVEDLQKDLKADLYNRPQNVDMDLFKDTYLVSSAGTKTWITGTDARKIIFQLCRNGYITPNGAVTAKLREDSEAGKLMEFVDELAPLTQAIYTRVRSVFDASVLDRMIENGNRIQAPANNLNANFCKKEFQELWKLINHKYVYTVSFDTEELVRKAVRAIDRDLHVSRLSYRTIRGSQKSSLRRVDFTSGDMMRQGSAVTEVIETAPVSHVRYDIVGRIASATVLTRRTVATILSGIHPSKFVLYKVNPEEFMSRVAHLIKEQKSNVIAEHIEYSRLEDTYDADIFIQEKRTSMDRAYRAGKCVTDYVFIEGSVERTFVENLEAAEEVVVYARLPKGFHIPTPVGNYSPDWAIAFREDRVKRMYFVAETKRTLPSMELQETEKSRMACVEKLFATLSKDDVRFGYGMVDSFDTLLSFVK